ncbi:MAG: flagellar biosynthesis protein FlhA [Alphaproteobacteria bacterium TMED194]|nr:MAG: flagellar biosynthesis protein FlhA [Alphaproteobacteria bacterium TMED194]
MDIINKDKSLIIKIISSISLPIGILILMTMMVIPLPVFLLDVFFTSNILISLIVLMVALQTFRPLDFSSFPTVLLFATVLRLGLNVASTRIVLSQGHTGTDAAGNVIEAFGNFVIGNDYVVGIFVFAILIIINLVVITKGAGRVSEVSARFTLDAMPGKQMAIDADLGAGILSSEEAKEKRQSIEKEADFYGAMDGASKFVKGDAIAAILILIINVVGGLIIGTTQHDLSFTNAAENYVILSVGDGLVAQIPSLLLAMATAVIVTRISSNFDLSEQISQEVGMTKAWFPAAGVLLLIGFIPGMPNLLFIICAFFAGGIGYYLFKKSKKNEIEESLKIEEENNEEDKDTINLNEIADNSSISIQLGYGLIKLVDKDNTGPLISRVTGVRRQVSKDLGFIVPSARITDDLNLGADEYTIKLGHTVVGQNQVFPDKLLAIPGSESDVKIAGIEVKDPSFNMDAVWIDKFNKDKAEAAGYMIVTPEAVIATHLNQLLIKHAGDLIGQDEVQDLLDNLQKSSPKLVETVVPKILPLNQLTGILKILLAESVPITDLKRVLELLSNINISKMSIVEIAEIIRPALVGLLIQKICPINKELSVITLSPEMEQIIINALKEKNTTGISLDPIFTKNMLKAIAHAYETASSKGDNCILLTSPIIRKDLSNLIRQNIEDLHVLAFTELPETRRLNIIATIENKIQEENNK